jgi:hypothetical protein
VAPTIAALLGTAAAAQAQGRALHALLDASYGDRDALREALLSVRACTCHGRAPHGRLTARSTPDGSAEPGSS